MNVFGTIVLAAIACGAFALTMAAKSVGPGECGGRCTGCGKCGKAVSARAAAERGSDGERR